MPEGNGFFSIGADNGQIRTIKPLDYETAKVHYLLVTATDTGVNSRSTVANVTVLVEDVEDVLPVFPQRLYTAEVPENERDYLVTTVEVSICFLIQVQQGLGGSFSSLQVPIDIKCTALDCTELSSGIQVQKQVSRLERNGTFTS